MMSNRKYTEYELLFKNQLKCHDLNKMGIFLSMIEVKNKLSKLDKVQFHSEYPSHVLRDIFDFYSWMDSPVSNIAKEIEGIKREKHPSNLSPQYVAYAKYLYYINSTSNYLLNDKLKCLTY